MFEKIAQQAFNDELEKIARETYHEINPNRTNKLNPKPIAPKLKGKGAEKILKGLGRFGKIGAGAIALSGLAFGAGSMMAANSGAGAIENGY